MRTSKRILAMLLALMMVLQMAPVVGAEEAAANVVAVYVSDSGTIDATKVGYYWDAVNIYYADGTEVKSYALADQGIALTDYNQVHAATIDGKAVNVKFLPAKGNALLSLNSTNWWNYQGLFNFNFGVEGNVFTFDDETVIDETVTVTDTSKANPVIRISSQNAAALDHANDLYLEQTLKFDSLPVKTVAHHGVFQGNSLTLQFENYQVGGFSYFLYDRPDTGTASSFLATVQNVGDGKLSLFVADSNSSSAYGSGAIDLGVSVGEEFVLGTQWNADGSADIYVNDVFVATVANATRPNGNAAFSRGRYYGASYNAFESEGAKFTVSNVGVYGGLISSVAEDSASATLEEVVAAANLGVVTGDVVLPAAINYAHGAMPITWTTSDASVITASGKVTAANEDKTATLTASAVGQSVQVNVTVPGTFSYVAEYTADVAAESEAGYYWDAQNLYYYNGELSTYALADLGIAPTDYYQSFKATIGGKEMTFLFAPDKGDAVAVFAADDNGVMNVPAYADFAADGSAFVYDSTTAANAIATVQSRSVEELLHTKDLYLEQTLKFDALPVKAVGDHGVFKGNEVCAMGFTFFMSNRDDVVAGAETTMLATVQNVGDGALALFIANSSAASGYGSLAINLGVNVGETFKLGTQWNADGSVDVYVNDVYVTSVANATRVLGYRIGTGNYYGLKYGNLEGEAKFTVSDVAVYNGVPQNVAEDTAQTSFADLIAGLDLGNVTESVALPTQVVYGHGAFAINWTSSNPEILAADGTLVAKPEEDTVVTLTASCAGATAAKQVTVLAAAQKVNANYVAAPSAINAATVGFYWDATNLYYADGTQVSTYALTELGIALTDYNQVFNVKVDGVAYNVKCVPTRPAAVATFTGDNGKMQNNKFVDFVADGANIVYDSANAANTVGYAQSYSDAALTHTKDLYLEQTISIDALPVKAVADHGVFNGAQTCGKGLTFYLSNRDDTVAGEETAMLATIQNEGDGALSLYIANSNTYSGYGNAGIKLGVNVGDTFKLGTQWNADGSVDVYVNGQLVGSVTDGTRKVYYVIGSGNYYSVMYGNLEGDAKFTVSNASVYYEPVESIADDTLVSSLDALFAGYNLRDVREDIVLPASVAFTYGAMPVTWVSSAPEIISNTGAVTRPEDSTIVTLTAMVGTKQLGSVQVMVTGTKLVLSNPDLGAYRTENIQAVTWNYKLPFTGVNVTPAGKLGAYWDNSNIYIGISYEDATKVELTVNGYKHTEELNGTGTKVITVPMSKIGFTVTDYNQYVQLQGVLYNANGDTAMLAQDAAKLYFSAQTDVTADISIYSTTDMTNNDGVIVIDKDFNADETATLQSYEIALFNGNTGLRSQNFLMQQNICIEKLPVTTAGAVTAYGATQGLYFFLCDRTDDPARADNILQGVFSVDADGDLSLVIGKSSAVIDLGMKLGQSFVLGTQWNMNDGVEIYVDGVYKATVNGGVYVENYVAPANGYGINVRNIDGEVKATFSGLTVRKPMPTAISEEVNQNTVSQTVNLLNPLLDLNAVDKDIELPTTIDTNYLGQLPLTWKSSNESVISSDGKVSEVTSDTKVTLTAKLGSRTVCQLNVTVGAKVEEVTGGPNIAAYKTSFIYFESWTYPVDFAVQNGSLTGKIDARWNSSTLYLNVKYTNATSMKITIGDYVKDVSLSSTSGNKRVDIKLSDIGTKVLYSNQIIKVQVVLTDASGNTAMLSETEANVFLTVKPSTSIYAFPEMINTYTGGCNNFDYTTTSGKYVLDTETVIDASTTAITDSTLNIAVISGTGNSDKIDHAARNMILQQTICIQAMPVVTYKYNGSDSTGYTFYIVDRLDVDGDGNLDGEYCDSMVASIFNAGGGKLKLYVADAGVIDLHKNLGDTFVLGTQWNMDNTVDVYVDGIYLGSVRNATRNLTWSGSDNLTLRYNHITDAVKLTVTGVTIYDGIPAANVGKLTQEGLETLVAESNPGLELDKVSDNIVLPTSYTNSSGDEQTIEWSSSNASVVSATGVVTQQQANVKVELTATVNGETAGVLSITVLGANRLTSSIINAAYTASDVTLDGAISEEGWTLNTAAIVSGNAILRLGAQWKMDTLYLAMDTADLNAVTLQLAGVQIDLNAAQKATSGTVTELAIPMSDIGVSVLDYGLEIPMDITVGDNAYSIIIKLTSIDWFSTDNTAHRIPVYLSTNNTSVNNGAVAQDDGYYIYDHFGTTNAAGSGATVYFRYPKADTTQPTTVPVWPEDQTYYFQFDFQATSMPVYTGSVAGCDTRNSNYGASWSISGPRETVSADGTADVVLFGMYNNGQNLVFVVSGEDALISFPLDKKVGDLFRVGVAVDPEGNMTVFIDGEEVRYITNAEKKVSALVTFNEDAAINFRVYRNEQAPASSADNFDVYMTNYAFGLYYGQSVLDGLTFDSIKGKNTDQWAVTSNLSLPSTLENHQLTNPVPMVWTSSNPDVIADDGTVTRPTKNGQLVTMTALTADGFEKQIQVYVKGKNPANTIMTITKDLHPDDTYGKITDIYEFTLDTNNNSIIYNHGSSQTVNVVRLTDGDTVARLHPDVLELYISTDNKNYTQIKDFKLLQDGKNWYLYGFEATGRYVKVHCTHYDGSEADFTGPLSNMITAYYDADFALAGESFANTVSYTVTNDTSVTKTDNAWQIPASQLGSIFLAENNADARFFLDGQLLYHYYENGNFYVRIPSVAANGSVVLTVKAGNASAMDISNKEYVYEMIYGTREVRDPKKDTNNRTARTLTMSNGVVIGIDCHYSGNSMVQQFSYDGGKSWTAYEEIPCSVDWMGNATGFIHDSLNDRIYFFGYSPLEEGSPTRVIYTDDCGATWYRGYDLSSVTDAAGYVDGIELSCNDGIGPNVDMVIGMGGARYDSMGERIGLYAVAVYTTDGGATWVASKDKLTVDTVETGVEAGLSENSVYEMADGTLVLYGRWQVPEADHFAVFYSYDHGITWTTEPVESKVYTVNTNPVLIDDDGTAILLWSGNAALGGTSYRRIPLSIATSTDAQALLTFENIQDLYVKYSLQGLDTATQNQSTNPHISINGDNLLIHWFNNFVETLYMQVDDYEDFLYKTKGAYDSFEGRNAEYEGWATIYGSVEVSQDVASHGSSAMLVNADASVVRSVPSVSNGQLSLDLYVPVSNASFRMELQTAFSNDASASPVVLDVKNGRLGGVELNTGWNEIVFDLALQNGAVAMSVNGVAVEIACDSNVGEYICYFYLRTGSETGVYVDDFTLIDRDEEIAYAASYKGVKYQNVTDAFADAADGGKVTLLSHQSVDTLSVNADVILDLNGYTLTADAVVSFGDIIDSSAESTGLLVAADAALDGGNDQLALYDAQAQGYRFYNWTVRTLGTRTSGDNVVFGFTIDFANEKAYDLLVSGESGASVQAKLAWDGMEGEAKTFSFSDEMVARYVQMQSMYPNMTVALMLTVSGTDTLAADSQVSVTPGISSQTGVETSGDAIIYTVTE